MFFNYDWYESMRISILGAFHKTFLYIYAFYCVYMCCFWKAKQRITTSSYEWLEGFDGSIFT